jgi:hypothetical protein
LSNPEERIASADSVSSLAGNEYENNQVKILYLAELLGEKYRSEHQYSLSFHFPDSGTGIRKRL